MPCDARAEVPGAGPRDVRGHARAVRRTEVLDEEFVLVLVEPDGGMLAGDVGGGDPDVGPILPSDHAPPLGIDREVVPGSVGLEGDEQSVHG